MRNNTGKLIEMIKGIVSYPNAEAQGVIEFSEYESEDNFVKTNFGETEELISGVLKNGKMYLYSYENDIPTVEEDAVIKSEDGEIIYLYLLN